MEKANKKLTSISLTQKKLQKYSDNPSFDPYSKFAQDSCNLIALPKN